MQGVVTMEKKEKKKGFLDSLLEKVDKDLEKKSKKKPCCCEGTCE
jgi:hypothetical protein